MEIRFHTCDGQGSIFIKNDNIEIIMNEDTQVFKRLEKEIENGLMDLEHFKNKGIPGKIKYNRKYKDKEDILMLLKKHSKEFIIHNLVIVTRITKSKNFKYNILEVDNLILDKLSGNENCILEFDEKYEYCITEEYEKEYINFKIEKVQLGNLLINLVMTKEEKIIVSIEFSKDIFNLRELIDWIRINSIVILKDKDEYLKNACQILESIKFKGAPIISYESGKGNILINKGHLTEMKKFFNIKEGEINIFDSETISGPKTNLMITLNGDRIDYIPEIEIEFGKDLIFSNGQLMIVTYIGAFGSNLGFFEEKGDEFPISWILDEVKDINIVIYEKEDCKIINIENNINSADILNYFS